LAIGFGCRPNSSVNKLLRNYWEKRIEMDVAITGRLIPKKSIIYYFAHDEPGQGMAMPVVHAKRVNYALRD
jgi:hypothetical protein